MKNFVEIYKLESMDNINPWTNEIEGSTLYLTRKSFFEGEKTSLIEIFQLEGFFQKYFLQLERIFESPVALGTRPIGELVAGWVTPHHMQEILHDMGIRGVTL